MRTFSRRLLVGALVAPSLATFGQAANPFAENVRTTPALAPDEQQKKFRLPPGFEIALVAAEPEISKPMNMAFDAKGRLWVTESTEYPFPLKPEEKGRDKIRVLEDTDGDGRADKNTVFAEGLNIPIGLYPYKNGVIAHSIPNVSFYQDTDGDGKADKVDVLYSGFGYRDTHGMTNSFRRGFDGWLYATHGFNNESNIVSKDKSTSIKLVSGNVYRMSVDGNTVEQFAWGPINPFGAAFDHLGNFFISDCHSWPLINVIRNAWYPQFGRPHNGLGFGPQMMNHLHNSTAIDGACYYDAPEFPEEFRHNLFVGNVVTSRINRDKLDDKGSTRNAVEQPDFLTCDDPWFRPVDIQLGPDGALYVADFYNRIIGHYEVPLTHPGRVRDKGRIWKITYKGTKGAPSVPLAGQNTRQLIESLAHANIKVRFLAADELFDRIGPTSVDALKAIAAKPTNANQKAHAMWLLHRFGALDDATLIKATIDKDRAVRVHALRILSEKPDLSEPLRNLAFSGLRDPDATVRRAAADALMVHPAESNIRPLLDVVHATPAEDTHLLHTARTALHESPVFTLLHEDQAKAQKWSLSAKDRDVLARIVPAAKGPEAAKFLAQYLSEAIVDARELPGFVAHLAENAPAEKLGEHVALFRKLAGESPDRQLNLLKPAAEAYVKRGGEPPRAAAEWGGELFPALMTARANDARARSRRIRDGLDTLRILKASASADLLKPLLKDKLADAPARAAVAKALLASDRDTHLGSVVAVMNDGAEPIAVRDAVAQTIAELNTPNARATLLSAFATAPYALQTKLAQTLAVNAEGAKLLTDAIEKGMLTPRLLLDPPVVQRLTAAKIADLEQRIAALTKGVTPPSDDLQKLIDDRRSAFANAKGNPELGAAVFAKTCVACHSIDGQGANVGPQLDGIGARGLDRIVEDVLDPNRNVDPAFYLTSLQLKSGDFIDGLLRREEGDLVVMADSTGKEVPVRKSDIQKRTTFKRSAMPDNFHEAVPQGDFHHLMAFLLSKGPKAP